MLLASALVFYNAPTAGVCAHGHIDGKRNGPMRAARRRRLAPHPRGALSPHTTPGGARQQRRRQGDEEARKWQINVENVALCVGLRRRIFLRHKFSRSVSRSTKPRSLLLADPKARRSPPSRSRSRDRAPDFLAHRARARNEPVQRAKSQKLLCSQAQVFVRAVYLHARECCYVSWITGQARWRRSRTYF